MAKASIAYVLFNLCLVFLLGTIIANPVNTDESLSSKLRLLATKADIIDSKVNVLRGVDEPKDLVDIINTKLDTIDSKLDAILDDGGNIKEFSETTTVTSVTRESTVPAESTTTAAPEQNCVDLISMERTPVEGGNVFTLRFRKNRDDLTFRLSNPIGEDQVKDSAQELGGGMWSISYEIPLSPLEGMDPWVMVGDKNYHHSFWLGLSNKNSSYDVLQFGEVPEIHLSRYGEITYSEGENIHIEASVTAKNITDVDGMDVSFSGIDLDTGKYQDHYPREDLFNYTEPEYADDKVEASFTMLTSNNHLSGYLQVSVNNYQSTGYALVPSLINSRHIMVHPVDQSGVFPPGYLAMADMPYMEKSDNGNDLTKCSKDVKCPLQCLAVGVDLTEVVVLEVKPDGTMANVSSAKQLSANDGHFIFAKWTAGADAYPGDDNGITTFRCEAYDSTGRFVYKLYDYLVVTEPSLIEEESSITTEYNGFEEIVTLNCTVTGRPLPDVMFNFPQYAYGNPADHVTPTEDPNKYIASLRLELDIQEAEALYRQIRNGETDAPSCEFYSMYGDNQKITLNIDS